MVLEKHGWRLPYRPIFGDHYHELRARVRKQRKSSPPKPSERIQMRSFSRRSSARSWRRCRSIRTIPDFSPLGDLSKFRRMKRHGPPDRFRLFYVFSSEAKTIIYLYLNDRDTLRSTAPRQTRTRSSATSCPPGRSARTSRPTTSSGSALALSGQKRKRRSPSRRPRFSGCRSERSCPPA